MERRQAQEKEKAARLQTDTEICVGGTKRKAFRKKEKRIIDSIWLAEAKTVTAATDKNVKKANEGTPVGNRVKKTKKCS